MDLIPTLSYGLGVPCCLLATYVVERHGLKNGLQIGGVLTGIGKYLTRSHIITIVTLYELQYFLYEKDFFYFSVHVISCFEY